MASFPTLDPVVPHYFDSDAPAIEKRSLAFRFTGSGREYFRIQLKNLALTLLTLGLYRPFAVVSAYRHRLAHLMLEVDDGFDHVLAGVQSTGGAAGDASADLLGVDLSW